MSQRLGPPGRKENIYTAAASALYKGAFIARARGSFIFQWIRLVSHHTAPNRIKSKRVFDLLLFAPLWLSPANSIARVLDISWPLFLVCSINFECVTIILSTQFPRDFIHRIIELKCSLLKFSKI